MPRPAADLRHAVPHPGALRPQGQGRGDGRFHLPRRNPHHDRRRRIHHQRRRARHRQPACTARPASISWSKSRKATARCTAAASSPNAEAGSNARSPRKTPWPSASTRAARSPRRPSFGPWMRSTAPPKRSSSEFYTVENGEGRPASGRPITPSAPIIDAESGEELVKAGAQIGEAINKIQASSLKSVEVRHQGRPTR